MKKTFLRACLAMLTMAACAFATAAPPIGAGHPLACAQAQVQSAEASCAAIAPAGEVQTVAQSKAAAIADTFTAERMRASSDAIMTSHAYTHMFGTSAERQAPERHAADEIPNIKRT